MGGKPSYSAPPPAPAPVPPEPTISAAEANRKSKVDAQERGRTATIFTGGEMGGATTGKRKLS